MPSVFSMSKLPQKHVANQWVNSWDMLETKNIVICKYKVLNISVVTPLGESQADHSKKIASEKSEAIFFNYPPKLFTIHYSTLLITIYSNNQNIEYQQINLLITLLTTTQ